MTHDSDRCAISRCRNVAALTYLGRPLCWQHWDAVCKKHEKSISLSPLPGPGGSERRRAGGEGAEVAR